MKKILVHVRASQMHYFLRVLALTVLVLMTIVDLPRIQWLRNEEIQMVLGTIIIFVLVMYDVLTGALLAASLFIAYFRLNKANFNVFDWASSKNFGDILELSSAYVSEEHLKAAQSNLVSEEDYEKEMIGIEGSVYGAQGIDKTMPGYANGSTLGVMRAAADY